MTSRFIALPLRGGEAFLLETRHAGRDWAILVDSGMVARGDPHPLVAAITRASPGLHRIDIAICTHQDADHAGGFRTFADQWCQNGRELIEFWLPGRWAAALPQVLLDPVALAERILAGAHAASAALLDDGQRTQRAGGGLTFDQRLRELAPLEELVRAFDEVAHREPSAQSSHATLRDSGPDADHVVATALGLAPSSFPDLQRGLEDTDYPPHLILRSIARQVRSGAPSGWFSRHQLLPLVLRNILFLHAIETATTIAAIAQSALRLCIRIRWFDFGLFENGRKPRGGIAGFFEPLSSVELRQPPSLMSNMALFFSMVLSRQNVESLVFLRFESCTEPGVMFLGDSRLSFGLTRRTQAFPLPPTTPARTMLITAPHHGSRVNDDVYEILRNWIGNSMCGPIYVRNGGHHNQRLGAFLQERNRCCAQCRDCGRRPLCRRIEIAARNGVWGWPARRVPACRR